MKILFDYKPPSKPAVSLILLDWSVRESFHVLRYLNDQSVPRDQYQIIWVEYYGRRADEIDAALRKAAEEGSPSPVDTWAMMGIPETAYYHKHLMYNMGIALSRGRIVCVMDSDAVASPRFIETIIGTFEENRDIVLHIDQLRNFNRKFYPFNYPSVEEIEHEGPTNALGGKPEGLLDRLDPLHTRNYGACMCALRDDLIAIGGADEHIDYLGHVCGPYEMTLRLANAGKREVWHQSEWLYHTWHPGQAGHGNYVGPSDGRNISSTALDLRRTGRVLPLRENPAMSKLRTELDAAMSDEALLELALSEVDIEEWDSERLDKSFVPEGGGPGNLYYALRMFRHPLRYLRHLVPFFSIFGQQLKSRGGLLKGLSLVKGLWRQTWQYRGYVMERSRQCLSALEAEGIERIALWGTGALARIFYMISDESPVKITAVYGEDPKGSMGGMKILPVEVLRGYGGKLVVAENVHVGDTTVKRLREAGVEPENIVLLI